MSRVREVLGHPFWQAIVALVVAYLLFSLGIAYLPPLVGVKSAPVPKTVLFQYMAIVAVGILLHVSSDERRWRRFREPIHTALVDPRQRWVRGSLLILMPLLFGFAVYAQTRPRVDAPAQLRSIHPAPPSQITFKGKPIALAGLENPLRTRGDMAEHLRTGKRIYYQNCLPCHGDRVDGQGHFAHGFSPAPASFEDNGTISQLTESYVFWRVAKGGPGLPREGTPWNSAMPVWENFLTEDEIWAVVLYIYEQSGSRPRRWEATAEEHRNPTGQKQPIAAPSTPKSSGDQKGGGAR
jgi:mono/diheme cytochrome c family protein